MRCFILLAVLVVNGNCVSAQSAIPLIDIKSVDPTIVIELRYAGANNLAGRALYAPGSPALVRPEVALRLVAAQAFLRRYKYGLKIWDAYRPKSVQMQLWQAAHKNHDYVADPQVGAGSLHSWGLAVDATLIDTWRRPVLMPTDYDNFTPAAMWHYQGADPAIRSHLHLLQIAMRDAGFYGQPTEWWHFVIADWQKYLPREEAERATASFGIRSRGQLFDQPNGNSHEPRDVPLTKKQNRAPKGKNVEQLYFQMTNGLTGRGPKTRSVRVKTCGSARRFQL